MRRPLAAGLLVGLLAAATVLWWRGPVPSAGPLLLPLLPGGSVAAGQARVELDGRPPVELAAVVYIPAYPGATPETPHAVLTGYDRWRRRWRLLYLTPLPGPPMTLEAGPLLGPREGAVFAAFVDGRVEYRVLGHRWGRTAVLRTGHTEGRVEVRGGVLVERDPRGARGYRWDGRTFRPVTPPPPAPAPLAWRYWYDRRGVIQTTETTTVTVAPGQVVRLVRRGGGPTIAPIPDPNLDVVPGGFRARRPGLYTITFPDFAERASPFQLTIRVEDARP